VRERGGRALLGVRIETGRTHQVRVQLAAIGAPVAGDTLYGGPPAFRLLLHSQRLAFEHPRDGRRIALEAAAPLEFDDWLAHGARPAYRDPALLSRVLEHACEHRFELGRALAAGTISAFRLLHEDADGVPSFGVDVYGSRLVVRVRDEVEAEDEAAFLAGLARLGARAAYIKRHPKQANELANEAVERIAPVQPVLGDEAPPELIVHEHGVPFEVRLHDGLRTGLFLDQRDNRKRVAELAKGQRVLNLFAYTGSFSVSALAGGAQSVTTVDVSRAALAWAERNVARIGASARHTVLAEDAFVALSQLAARGERFDLVIVDPPSYSTSKRGRFRVTKDYVSLCRAALRVLEAGGVLLACVNHHGLSQLALRRFVREAADAERVQLDSIRDAPCPVDFPSGGRGESPTKSVFARVTAGTGRARVPV
jgi:23S rRNA (cytosine1962-C5)-methyltransferase